MWLLLLLIGTGELSLLEGASEVCGDTMRFDAVGFFSPFSFSKYWIESAKKVGLIDAESRKLGGITMKCDSSKVVADATQSESGSR